MATVHIGRDPVLLGADDVLVQSVGIDACHGHLRLVHIPQISHFNKYPYTIHKPTSELNYQVAKGYVLWAWTETPFSATYNVTNPDTEEGIELGGDDEPPEPIGAIIGSPAITSVADLPVDLSVDGFLAPCAYINVDASSGDFDLTNWYPLGLKDGALITLRKVDSSSNKIIFTDVDGYVYDYLDIQKETLILQNYNASSELRVI